MMRSTDLRRSSGPLGALCFFAAAVLLSATTAPAQPSGLDSLTDDALYVDLANRGLNSLLDRAFETNHVAPEKRQAIQTLSQLHQLSDPSAKLTPRQRQEMVRRIATGIDAA